jgi:hypothetical protein
LDTCEERRDQAERRKFELFHKSLQLLNITKVFWLQASTETPLAKNMAPEKAKSTAQLLETHSRRRIVIDSISLSVYGFFIVTETEMCRFDRF